MIAALFVADNGPYVGIEGVDAWTESRDARLYPGPHPVVAHPPCERWGRYARKYGRIGQDDACFESAVNAVRRFGGVLEHPQGSLAFALFQLPVPPSRGWSNPDKHGGRSCCVYQGHYGHRAPKATWLYSVGGFPELIWGKTAPRDLSHLSEQARRRAIKTGICQRLSRRQRMITPDPFRNILIEIARGAK